jgi:hypothetical protein
LLLAASREHVLVVAVAVAVVGDHLAGVLAVVSVVHACLAASLDAPLSAHVAVPFLLAVKLLILEIEVVFVLLVSVGPEAARLGKLVSWETLAASNDWHHVAFEVRRWLETTSLLGHAPVEALVYVAWLAAWLLLLMHSVVVPGSLWRSLTAWRHVEHPAVACLRRVGDGTLGMHLLLTTSPGQLVDATTQAWNGLVGDVLFGHPWLLDHDLHVLVAQI